MWWWSIYVPDVLWVGSVSHQAFSSTSIPWTEPTSFLRMSTTLRTSINWSVISHSLSVWVLTICNLNPVSVQIIIIVRASNDNIHTFLLVVIITICVWPSWYTCWITNTRLTRIFCNVTSIPFYSKTVVNNFFSTNICISWTIVETPSIVSLFCLFLNIKEKCKKKRFSKTNKQLIFLNY